MASPGVPVPLVIDCDPGIDDMVALLVAAASPELRLLGVTTVCGNVGVATTTRNALAVLALAGREDVPVYAGAHRPLVHDARRAEDVHGSDGLGGTVLPDPRRAPEPEHAVEFLARTVRSSAEPLTLVAVGPLTNVALFFATYPEEAARLGRLVVMGGSIGAGNTTPAGEFNVWFDPEAAHRVFTDTGLPRPVPTVQIGLEVTCRTAFDPAGLDRLRATGPVPALAADALAFYLRTYADLLGEATVPVHDAVAVCEALRPGLVRTRPAAVAVDCGLGPARGTTAIDLSGCTGAPRTVEAGVDVDVPAVMDLIVRRVARAGDPRQG